MIKDPYLDLSGKNLNKFPQDIDFKHIKILDLSNNKMQSIDFKLIKNCEILNVANNLIDILSSEISKLKSLKELDLTANKLISIPSLPNQLVRLIIADNQLPSGSFKQLELLKELDISGNGFTIWPKLPKSIINLNVSFNFLTNVFVDHIENLIILKISDNLLSKLPILPINLEELDAGNNRIMEIGKLPLKLKILILSGNFIEQLPETIGNLIKLETLDLHSNKLKSIPETIRNCKNLNKLDVTGNTELVLPISIGSLSKLVKLNASEQQISGLSTALDGLPPQLAKLYASTKRTSVSRSRELHRFVSELKQQPSDRDLIWLVPISETTEILNSSSLNISEENHDERLEQVMTELLEEKEKIRKDRESVMKEIQLARQERLEAEHIKTQAIAEQQLYNEELNSMREEFDNFRLNKGLMEDSHNEISPNEIMDLSEIGAGAFGTVFLSLWRSKKVAVKRIHKQYLKGEYLKEFRREVMMLSKTRHPNIVLFMGACTGPNAFVVTEYCKHGSLYDCIQSGMFLETKNNKLRIAIDIALGMNYLHMTKPKMIIHRDLKSMNVLIDESGCAKVCDFGMSRIKEESIKLTAFRGSPCWMAPEVFRNEDYNEKVDVYAYGIVLWELYTLDFPYKGVRDPVRIALDVGFNHLRPDISVVDDEKWSDLIMICWDRIPQNRPSFQEILGILERF